MSYPWLKLVHQITVVISISGFIWRGILMLRESPLLQHRAVRVLPHINDTALLASALGLAAMLSSWPIQQSWLTAKLAGLVVYVILGSLALKHGKTRPVRITAFLLALAAFGYIVSVALSRNPAGFFAALA